MTVRRNGRKWLWWGAGILIVTIIFVVVAIMVINGNKEVESIKGQSSNQQTESANKNEEIEEVDSQISDEPKKEDIKQYDGESPNRSETLTGVISYAGINANNLIIRVNIDQYLVDGNCILNLTQNGAVVYSDTVVIEGSVSTSTCNGFGVSISEIPTGRITAEVTLESDGKYGKIMRELDI